MRCMKATYLTDHVPSGVRDHEFYSSHVFGGIYLVISRESQLISRQVRVFKTTRNQDLYKKKSRKKGEIGKERPQGSDTRSE
jgi:hypothetical protein